MKHITLIALVLAFTGCGKANGTLTKKDFKNMDTLAQIELMEKYGVSSFSEMNFKIAKGKIPKQ